MSRIPADLNKTMWEIADRGDRAAAADFAERFPALSADMESRMGLVLGMKGARKAIAPTFVPAFRPQYIPDKRRKWLRYAPAAMALAALAGASFYVTQNLLTPLPDPSTFGTSPIRIDKPERKVVLPPAPLRKQDYESDSPKAFSKNHPETTGATAGEGNVDPVETHLSQSQVHLQNVIHGVGDRYHLQIQIPPDFPNPIIDVDMTASSGIEFLNQLGNKYGFTAYDEAEGHILVVPAREGKPAGSSG